jgi:hypothetical protein
MESQRTMRKKRRRERERGRGRGREIERAEVEGINLTRKE